MSRESAEIGPDVMAWQRFGGDGPAPTVFLAANGFPVGSYRFMLEPLANDSPLLALENRGAWPRTSEPPEHFNWASHADDLIRFLEAQKAEQADWQPFLAIGHSIGGTVSAMAALKRPDLFDRLILIDPASLPGRWMPLLTRLMPSLMEKMDLVTRTRSRRYRWSGPEEFASFLRRKSVYKRFVPDALNDYVQAGLSPAADGFELTYAREWEAWNFQNTALLWPVVRKLKMPVLILRAEHSYLHPESDFRRQSRRLPANITALTIEDAGHMLPQEAPDAVLAAIRHWLA